MLYSVLGFVAGVLALFGVAIALNKRKKALLPQVWQVSFEIKNNIIQARLDDGRIFYSSIVDLSRNNLNWWIDGNPVGQGQLQATLTHFYSLGQMKQMFNTDALPPTSRKTEPKGFN